KSCSRNQNYHNGNKILRPAAVGHSVFAPSPLEANGAEWRCGGLATLAGFAGPQRFTSQHYGTKRAGSTFAADVWNNREHFGFEGEEERIDDWVLENFGRANIRVTDLPLGCDAWLPISIRWARCSFQKLTCEL
ncbi:hypothetical protein, partial [Leisingera sp. ANG-Vp]|uniref:hypothetical protein n=1 Tax=Leisingera sp. ANG-Vp TaxID=1577896 RepID=UPI0019D39EDF